MRRPEFESAIAALKQLNLKSLVMEAGSKSVAVRRSKNKRLRVEVVRIDSREGAG